MNEVFILFMSQGHARWENNKFGGCKAPEKMAAKFTTRKLRLSRIRALSFAIKKNRDLIELARKRIAAHEEETRLLKEALFDAQDANNVAVFAAQEGFL